MESLEINKPKKDFFPALRALFFEFLLIGAIIPIALGVLNYFNILSISETVPFLSFLPKSGGAKLQQSTVSVVGIPKVTSITKHVSSADLPFLVFEVSTEGGQFKTKNGDILPYEYKLKVKNSKGYKTYYFEKKDIAQISVVKNENNVGKEVSFSELKAGDRILMDFTSAHDANGTPTVTKLLIVKL